MTAIKFNNVSKTIGKAEIVRDFSDTFPSEKITVLLGPSGAGKTTTARLISGLEKVTSGEIFFDDAVVSSKSQHLAPQKRKIAYVFQDLALLPHLNVYKNLQVVHQALKIDKNKSKHLIQAVLEEFSLAGKEKRKIDELSGGEKQRVALARAILQNPKILILDEPFAGLDNQLKNEIAKIIQQTIRKYKLTTILITHNLEEAFDFADKIIFMKNGRVVESGVPGKLNSESKSLDTAIFLDSVNILDQDILKLPKVQKILHTMFAAQENSGANEKIALNVEKNLVVAVKPEDVHLATDSDVPDNCIAFDLKIIKSRQAGNRFVNSAVELSSNAAIKFISVKPLEPNQNCKVIIATQSLIFFSNSHRIAK